MLAARREAGMPLEGQNLDDICALRNGEGNGGNPNQWADQTKNIKQFSYDADLEAEKWWEEEGEQVLVATAEKPARL